MSLFKQLQAAAGNARPPRRESTRDADRKTVRDVLSSTPMTRKRIIELAGLSPERTDRAIASLRSKGRVATVSPGELGKRVLYVLSLNTGE
jgi:hypothetical protein